MNRWTPPPPDGFVTKDEAAHRLGVSLSTINRRVRDGSLVASGGWVTEESLEAYDRPLTEKCPTCGRRQRV